MTRGDVRWYEFGRPDKRRPVLILTRKAAISHLNYVTVAPISSTVRDVPSQVRLSESDGMKSVCAVNLHHITSVPRRDIGSLLCQLKPHRMREITDAIRYCLEFDADLEDKAIPARPPGNSGT